MSQKWILPCLMALGSLWQLWEQDIYWQIRMGEDFLRTWSVFRVEDWSYTARGFADVNFWWLPSIFVYAAERLSGDSGLVLLRGVCVALYLLFCVRILPRNSSLAAVSVSLAVVFAAAGSRFQLRPDFLIAVVMAGLVAVWASEATQKSKLIWSFVACLLASNFHMGPQVFVILAAIALVWASPETRARKLGLSAAMGVTFFLTPFHFHSVPLLLKSFAYGGAGDSMKNYDWESFGPQMFVLSNWGLTGLAWLALIALALFGFSRKIDGVFGSRPVRGLFLLMLLVSFYRARGIIYFAPLALPYVAIALGFFTNEMDRRKTILFSTLGLMVFVAHIRLWPHPYGLKVDDWVYPRRGVDLVRELKPKGNILHDASLGNYMLWHLREYPVLLDTRQYPFEEIGRKVADAGKDPAKMAPLIQELDVNVVFLPVPQTPLIEGAGLIDAMRPFFPADTWALIYFDNHYMLLLKRIPEHADAIAKLEYKLLTPQFPSYFQGEPPAPAAELQKELQRCLNVTDDNLYCGFRKAFSEKNGELISAYEKVPQFWNFISFQIDSAFFFGKPDEAAFLQKQL